jgi:hypothetical protein
MESIMIPIIDFLRNERSVFMPSLYYSSRRGVN